MIAIDILINNICMRINIIEDHNCKKNYLNIQINELLN